MYETVEATSLEGWIGLVITQWNDIREKETGGILEGQAVAYS